MDYKEYLSVVRRQIIENTVALLNDATLLYEKSNYQRAAFVAMTCIEECGKIPLLKNLGFGDKELFHKNKDEINQLLRDHTDKVFETASTSFFINAGSDRRQGTNKKSNILNSNGVMILARSKKWMEWRNACLYVDINIENETSASPIQKIGKKEACYFIRMAHEAAAETGQDCFDGQQGVDFWKAKIIELDKFITNNKDVDIDEIEFLSNPAPYRALYKD